jgi:hypothetical protein
VFHDEAAEGNGGLDVGLCHNEVEVVRHRVFSWEPLV